MLLIICEINGDNPERNFFISKIYLQILCEEVKEKIKNRYSKKRKS
jgi:hypothetical protein